MVRTCERGRGGGGRRARDVSRLFLRRFCRCARSTRKGGIRGARDAHLYAWRRALESRSSETPRTWSAADLFIALALVSPSQMEHSFETTTLRQFEKGVFEDRRKRGSPAGFAGESGGDLSRLDPHRSGVVTLPFQVSRCPRTKRAQPRRMAHHDSCCMTHKSDGPSIITFL